MISVPESQRVLTCTPSSAAQRPVHCFQVSPNPEYAQAPSNYAHWLLAHLYPLLAGAYELLGKSIGQLAGSTIRIGHGENTVLPKFASRYEELWDVTCSSDRMSNSTLLEGCTAVFQFSLPRYTMCVRDEWRVGAFRSHWLAISDHLFALLLKAERGSVEPLQRLIVLQRDDSRSRANSNFGLEGACEAAAALPGWSMPCTSARFNHSVPLHSVVSQLGMATAFLAAHGAGMANVVFLRRGAVVAEVDSAENVRKARLYYQWMATAAGLRPHKVWLHGDNGSRACPRTVRSCSGVSRGPAYHANSSIAPTALTEALGELHWLAMKRLRPKAAGLTGHTDFVCPPTLYDRDDEESDATERASKRIVAESFSKYTGGSRGRFPRSPRPL